MITTLAKPQIDPSNVLGFGTRCLRQPDQRPCQEDSSSSIWRMFEALKVNSPCLSGLHVTGPRFYGPALRRRLR